jgi:hypothetical protein
VKVTLVLRSGGEYRPEHVDRLVKQIEAHLTGAEIVCFSDVDVPCERIPLRHDWPGWWSKMCMFEDAREPFLYMDLDTTIAGPLDEIMARRDLTVLSDFYWPQKIQSSLMLVTPRAANTAWQVFSANPERHMRECVTRERWGDQGFLDGVWGQEVARWQDVLPGQAVSYKVHVRRAQNRHRETGNGTVPAGARVIVFHGEPRPWKAGW